MFRALLVLLFAFPLAAQEHIEVRVLDVGQADAVLIQHQGRAMLYDAGDRGSPAASRLMELGIDTLDLLVASHPHADHIGGMAAVLDSLVVLAYADPGTDHTTVTFSELQQSLENAGLDRSFPDSLGGAEIRWLHPPADSTHWGLNDLSLGLYLTLGDGSVSLAGDAEEVLWDYWVARDQVFPVTAHKSSHHGSHNGDTREAIERLRPEIVFIGVGEGNRYGHPRDEVLQLYEDESAVVLRTDHHGEVIIEINERGEYRYWTETGPCQDPVPCYPRWPWPIR